MPSSYPQALYEAVTDAIGTSDTDLGGVPFTFLSANISPTDTVIPVDSTYKFPGPLSPSKKIRIGTEVLEYIGQTATSFTVAERPPNALAYSRGRAVVDASRISSQVDSGRSQITYQTATGAFLRAILRNHGLALPDGTTNDDNLRNYGKIASYPPAGPYKFIADVLDVLLNGQVRYGDISGGDTLTLDGSGGGWPTGFDRRLVRVLSPSDNAGLYRIRSVSGLAATLEPFRGQYHDAAGALVDETNRAVELVPWDLWQYPPDLCRFRIDVIKFLSSSGVLGSTFIQGGEEATSTSTTTVDVTYEPTNVLGVYLAGDLDRSGTNFFEPGGTFAGTTITLGTALPSGSEPVRVDYGAIEFTGQVLNGPSANGVDYYPFYLGEPAALIEPFLDFVRAAGYLPDVSTIGVT